MNKKTGVWIIGAYGSVSTCLITGVEAIKAGLTSQTGLITALPEIQAMGLVDLGDLVFGGYEVRPGRLAACADAFRKENGVLTAETVEAVRDRLDEIDSRIKPGVALNCGPAVQKFSERSLSIERLSLSDVVQTIQQDLEEFKKRNNLQTVIVVNLASAEAFVQIPAPYVNEPVCTLVEKNLREVVPASVIYAYAALKAGFPYVNFTSSIGSSLPNLDELARYKKVPHMGKDGKTGETLVKTVLAPMFLARNLKVLSWESHNILGNRDGQVLNNPQHNSVKVADKDEAMKQIFKDNPPNSHVRIDYVPSLGDWKTAWDFIHFSGFLDTKMSLQFIWQGSDSALAAPLVIDLVRFTEFAWRHGESGSMPHLASFFKKPYGVDEQDFFKQYSDLMTYVMDHTGRKSGESKRSGESRESVKVGR